MTRKYCNIETCIDDLFDWCFVADQTTWFKDLDNRCWDAEIKELCPTDSKLYIHFSALTIPIVNPLMLRDLLQPSPHWKTSLRVKQYNASTQWSCMLIWIPINDISLYWAAMQADILCLIGLLAIKYHPYTFLSFIWSNVPTSKRNLALKGISNREDLLYRQVKMENWWEWQTQGNSLSGQHNQAGAKPWNCTTLRISQ